ncbi:hypothetical protein KIAC18_000314 [Sporomusa sphaeroides]|uniref:ComEC/Rec2 family competence protein n=1 Tax=Sporomusa sphaeroides TaxID=47679 RepID=UPI003DA1BDBB
MLRVHFLNVGHGDCCILEFPNRLTVVDINRTSNMDEESKNEILTESLGLTKAAFVQNLIKSGQKSVEQSLIEAGYNIKLTDPVSYIQKLGKRRIFRFISTHPHMDHLSGLNYLSQQILINNIWVVKNDFTQNNDKLTDDQKNDWKYYCKYRDSKEAKLENTTRVEPLEGSSLQYWKDDGISILAPNKELLKSDNPNDMSYVLLIKYGNCKILLGGDAGEKTWSYLEQKYKEELANISILKASHHGRDSGYYQPAIKLMQPLVTIVSVGKKPDTDVSNKYRQYCKNVFSTRWKGNMVFDCYEDGEIQYKTEYGR